MVGLGLLAESTNLVLFPCSSCSSLFPNIYRKSSECGGEIGVAGSLRFQLQQKNSKKKKRGRQQITANCYEQNRDNSTRASPYRILGIDPSSSLADVKAAFRAKVKEFHPDVCKDANYSDVMIRQVIQAYKVLLKKHESETNEREVDPFEEPECEAFDLFVNETLCIGKGCPYSCVKRAPYAFSFDSIYGTARATSQGHGEDYQVQLAVGQCPRSCIHYVTPSQRIILEELFESALNSPYSSAEAAMLESLIVKAKFENNRYQKPQKNRSKASDEFVDWF